MQIEMIDRLHLKVELSEEDMSLFQIKREAFLLKNDQAKIVLKSILRNAYEQTGFDIFSTKLLIEIFPTSSQGCIMIFTKSPDRKKPRFRISSEKKPIIFEFSDINFLLDCAKPLSQQNFKSETSLFSLDDKYYLCITPEIESLKSVFLILSEFNGKKSNITKEYLTEHAKVICKSHAIKNLAF